MFSFLSIFFSKSSTDVAGHAQPDIEQQAREVQQNASFVIADFALPSRPTRAHRLSSSSEDECTDAIDDFFGVTRPARSLTKSSSTHDSRHDDRLLVHVPTLPRTRCLSSSSTSSSSSSTTITIEGTEDECTDAIDDFFGVTRPKRTCIAHPVDQEDSEKIEISVASVTSTSVSQSSSSPPSPTTTACTIQPPPYDLESGLPTYTEAQLAESFKPYTIPEAFYRWGFFCPLFWFLGALFYPLNLHHPAELTRWYTPTESAARVHILRALERKWAKRCALASLVLVFVALVVTGVVLGIWMELKHT